VSLTAAPSPLGTSSVAQVRSFDAPALHGPLSSATARADALRAAHERAFAEGRAMGLEHGAAEIAGTRARLEHEVEQARNASRVVLEAARQLAAADALELEEFERSVCGLAVEIAEVILGHELQTENAVLGSIRAALAFAPRREPVEISVSPHDVDTVRSVMHELDLPDGSRVMADSSIGNGQCTVRAGACNIDQQVPAALRRVRAVLADLYGDNDLEVVR